MYTWAKVDKDVEEPHYFSHGSGEPITVDELVDVEQYEIIDPDGDQIAIVFSEGEAEALVSHLNR